MNRTSRHILYWASYVVFKTLLNFSVDEPVEWSELGLLLGMQLSFLPVKVPLVYACFYIVDRYLESKDSLLKSTSWLILAFGMAIVGMTTVNHKWIFPVLFDIVPKQSMFSIDSLFYHFSTLVFVVGISLALHLVRKQYQLKFQEAQWQKEKLETELKYLKAQLNPHFLFNTLNNIYSLARKGSVKTADAILKLADLMRYMLYEVASPEIPLKTELSTIADYIELEKLRYSERLRVQFQVDLENREHTISPLLLLNFVENAFKHGTSESNAEININISVRVKNNQLDAEFINPNRLNSARDNRTPIGLDNVRRQLGLLYPGHSLNIRTDNGLFSVKLSLPLTLNHQLA